MRFFEFASRLNHLKLRARTEPAALRAPKASAEDKALVEASEFLVTMGSPVMG
jgi:hypothetical protein